VKFTHVYDITALMGIESIDYPGDTAYSRKMLCELSAGAPYDLASLKLSAHSGTHLDAPAHFVPGGKTIDQYTIHELILPALVVPVSDRVAVQRSDLSGTDIRPGDAILFKTHNSTSGRSKNGRFLEDFVYLSLDAADLCVDKSIGLVGIDYISVDRFGDEEYPIHHRLSRNGILILEGIDLGPVPVGRYTLFCFPLKIAGGEAAPVRAVLVGE
jgi:arylformamidase